MRRFLRSFVVLMIPSRVIPTTNSGSWKLTAWGRNLTNAFIVNNVLNPGDDIKIVEMFRASAIDDRLGIPVRVDGQKIHYAYPVSILAAQRPLQ